METKPITKRKSTDKDLRFQVGKEYPADVNGEPGKVVFFSQEAADAYSEQIPKQRFVAIENRVHDNLRRLVCRARSGNMAKRIARALNIVKPNERGQ